MELKRVVVTGLGAITPIGNNISEFWNSVSKGVSGAGPITNFDASKFKTKFACEVKKYDPLNFFDRKEARKYDRFAQFALISANEAIKDAKINLEKEDLTRIGVIWGAGIGGITSFEKEVSEYVLGDGTPRFSPFFIPKIIADMSCGHISIKYGFKGPNFTTVSACASSTNAIIDAYNYIRLGKANMFITGGSEAPVIGTSIGGFNSMHALSTKNDEYMTASRPFSKSRDGFVVGEGGGALVLEELDHALARGAKIYGEVAGGGLTSDAYHITAPNPEGTYAAEVMRLALEDANMKPEDIDYINVHGTSTGLGDKAEVSAIKKVFGDYAYKLNISSTKSQTGHLLGAAGAIEAIACTLSINNGIIPPTINFREGDEDPDIDYNLNFTFNAPCKREVKAALSNTFGFGGHNASVIIKKWE